MLQIIRQFLSIAIFFPPSDFWSSVSFFSLVGFQIFSLSTDLVHAVKALTPIDMSIGQPYTAAGLSYKSEGSSVPASEWL